MAEYCKACYGRMAYCRACKTYHCDCSWNDRHQHKAVLSHGRNGPYMASSSKTGLGMLVASAASSLGTTKKSARGIIGRVVSCLEGVLADNIGTDGFSVKLGKFGKLTVRHRPPSVRRIPLTGEKRLTCGRRKVRFTALGRLRSIEKVPLPASPTIASTGGPQDEADVQR